MVVLADIEARLSKLAHQHEQELARLRSEVSFATGALGSLKARIGELERLWYVARENPELVRELAAQALKGREPG